MHWQAFIEMVKLFWFDLLHGQLPALGYWTYLLLSLLIVLQGPLASLAGGAAASAGLLKPFLVLFAGVMGNLAADIVWYSIGKSGKIEWFLRYGQRLGVRREHLEHIQINMRRHHFRILFLSKLSAGFAVPALLVAGLARVKWRHWFPVVFLGETLWTGFLVGIGYFFTEVARNVEQGIHLWLAAVSLPGILLLLRFLKQHNVGKSLETTV